MTYWQVSLPRIWHFLRLNSRFQKPHWSSLRLRSRKSKSLWTLTFKPFDLLSNGTFIHIVITSLWTLPIFVYLRRVFLLSKYQWIINNNYKLRNNSTTRMQIPFARSKDALYSIESDWCSGQSTPRPRLIQYVIVEVETGNSWR